MENQDQETSICPLGGFIKNKVAIAVAVKIPYNAADALSQSLGCYSRLFECHAGRSTTAAFLDFVYITLRTEEFIDAAFSDNFNPWGVQPRRARRAKRRDDQYHSKQDHGK